MNKKSETTVLWNELWNDPDISYHTLLHRIKVKAEQLERERDEARRLAETHRHERFRYGLHESKREQYCFPWENAVDEN
jgi:hypothetical protein